MKETAKEAATIKATPRKWRQRFDSRQQKQIDFSRVYVSQFGHGADGHNAMQIIAEMSYILDAFDTVNRETIEVNRRLEKENFDLRERLAAAGFDLQNTED